MLNDHGLIGKMNINGFYFGKKKFKRTTNVISCSRVHNPSWRMV